MIRVEEETLRFSRFNPWLYGNLGQWFASEVPFPREISTTHRHTSVAPPLSSFLSSDTVTCVESSMASSVVLGNLDSVNTWGLSWWSSG